jgi:hypothetical protein
MEESELPELPTIDESKAYLARILEDHFAILHKAFLVPSQDLQPVDHFVIAALRRSHANILGFVKMVDDGNKFCALPMTRMQLDSAMRLIACELVDRSGPGKCYEEHILKGGKPDRFKTKSKVKMRDAILSQELSVRHPQISEIYDNTSGYIHFSRHHLFGIIDITSSTADEKVVANIHQLPEWHEEDVRSALIEFIYATDCLLQLCKSWEKWKGAQASKLEDENTMS